MRTLALGHSGVEVSVLCLGTLSMGTQVTRDTSRDEMVIATKVGFNRDDIGPSVWISTTRIPTIELIRWTRLLVPFTTSRKQVKSGAWGARTTSHGELRTRAGPAAPAIGPIGCPQTKWTG